MQNNALMTGGSGLLAKYLTRYMPCDTPTHSEMDITLPETFKNGYSVVIHAAAYTDVVKAEKDQKKCYEVNVTGTKYLVESYSDSYFVYISSEYAYNPVNFYSYTKLWGEEEVKKHKNHLIIRTLFKPNPFPFDKAFADQYTEGDYVDKIAPLIFDAIATNKKGLIHIGTGRKSMYQLALKTKPHVTPISVDDIKDVRLPKDYLT